MQIRGIGTLEDRAWVERHSHLVFGSNTVLGGRLLWSEQEPDIEGYMSVIVRSRCAFICVPLRASGGL